MNLMTRCATCRSSLAMSLSAAVEYSMLHAIAPFHLSLRVGFASAGAQGERPLFGQVQVFEILHLLADGRNHVVGFAPAGALGEFFETDFQVFRQTKRDGGAHG